MNSRMSKVDELEEEAGCREKTLLRNVPVHQEAARENMTAGVSHDSPRTQTCTFQGPGLQNTTKFQRKDPSRKMKRMKTVAGEGKKKSEWAVLRRGRPAEGGPAEGPSSGGGAERRGPPES